MQNEITTITPHEGEFTYVQTNLLNRSLQQFDLLEKRLYSVVLMKLKAYQYVEPKDFDGRNLEIHLNISDITEAKDATTERLRRMCDNITSKKIVLEKSDDKFFYSSLVPFPQVTYDNGKITVVIFANILHYFLDLSKGYTSAYLKHALSMSSVYSLRLYELLLAWINIGKWTISIDTFRKMLNIDAPTYLQFRDINAKILKRGVAEIEKQTDLLVTYEVTKFVGSGRSKKADEITFYIKTKTQFEREIWIEDYKKDLEVNREYFANLSETERENTLIAIMERDFDFNREEMKKIIKNRFLTDKFIDVYVRFKVDEQTNREIKDIRKYMRKALIKEGFGSQTSLFSK
jgi:plasmid replication initiation protein